MYFKTGAKFIHRSKQQMSAVRILLDCANTTTLKNVSLKKRTENEVLCPWGAHKKEAASLLPELDLDRRPPTLLKHQGKRSFRIKQYSKSQDPRKERKTPKTQKRSKLHTIFHEEAVSKIVNLSKQLEIFHLRRKLNFLQRKQLSIRLKTQ